jgi:hypothetical protein
MMAEREILEDNRKSNVLTSQRQPSRQDSSPHLQIVVRPCRNNLFEVDLTDSFAAGARKWTLVFISSGFWEHDVESDQKVPRS